MDENLGAALSMVMLVGGLALIVSAVYLYYVALPEEQTRRHVIVRAVLAAVGLVLLLVGSSHLR